MCDVPSHDNSSPLDVSKDQIKDFSESKEEFSSTDDDSLPKFTTFLKVLFDAEYESDSSDDQSCSDEDVLEKIVSKPLPEEEIHLTKRLLYDNSSPRPPEEIVSDNSNADIESFSPSHISNLDSDPLMEEIDLSFNPDDPMPSGIEDDDYDSGRDI
nr:hypothetical protein [Tanacetum cinerariifolium]